MVRFVGSALKRSRRFSIRAASFPAATPPLERAVSDEDHGIGITLFARFAERIPIGQRGSIQEAVMREMSFPGRFGLDDELDPTAGSFSESRAGFDEDTPYRAELWFSGEIGQRLSGTSRDSFRSTGRTGIR